MKYTKTAEKTLPAAIITAAFILDELRETFPDDVDKITKEDVMIAVSKVIEENDKIFDLDDVAGDSIELFAIQVAEAAVFNLIFDKEVEKLEIFRGSQEYEFYKKITEEIVERKINDVTLFIELFINDAEAFFY